VKLTLKQALLGTLIVIPFLDSTKPPYQLRTYQEIITPQTEKRFPNEGLPYPKDLTKRGDLIVKFDILFPKLLNHEQRTFADCCFSNSTDFYQPHDSVLHTTIIDQIQQEEEQQQQQTDSTPPPPSSPLKSQPSSLNNHHHHHQKSPHRHIKNIGRQKSPAPTIPKTSSVRVPPPVPPRPSPTTTRKETIF
jgi:DnaJ-class molecular chaperone